MCGIAAIFAYHYAAPDALPEELREIRDHQRRRGPDGEGEWFSDDRRVAFGHTRLSILDLSEAGSQPMVSDSKDLIISYNGEIYNFREIRSRLQAHGVRFRSDCDTEVLLRLYEIDGERMFNQLLGMYAICLYDRRSNKLLLARDPFGIKPLYYADDGWTLRVASQVRSLVERAKVSRTVDPVARLAFHVMGSVPEPLTWFSSIKSVPAGTFVLVDELGVSKPQRYTQQQEIFGEVQEANNGEFVRQVLGESVSRHLEADVPVGLFLSAGLDSNVLLALMAQRTETTQAVTLAFEEFRGSTADESIIASETANAFGAQHLVRYVSKDEFLADFPRIISAMDQPTVDGINSWFVAKAAGELNLKVCLSGIGSDELFSGYPAFTDVPNALRYGRPASLMPGAGLIWQAIVRLMLASGVSINPKVAELVTLSRTAGSAYLLERGILLPNELRHWLPDEHVEEWLEYLPLSSTYDELVEGCQAPLKQVAILESSVYMRNQLLRDADWAGMAHSVEVRVPYVDREVFGRICGGSPHKTRLVNAFRQILPEKLIERQKTGFETPIKTWMRELCGYTGHEHWSRHWVGFVGRAYEESLEL